MMMRSLKLGLGEYLIEEVSRLHSEIYEYRRVLCDFLAREPELTWICLRQGPLVVIAAPLGFIRTPLSRAFSLFEFNEQVLLFEGNKKGVMHLTCLSLLFLCVPAGLSAYRGGLAEDPDGQVAGHQSARGHEDLVEVCQPLWEEWTSGQYIDINEQSSQYSLICPDHA